MTNVRHVGVVIPARNEEEHVQACLRGIALAVRQLNGHHPEVSVDVRVVLDRCTDRTAALVAAAGVRAVSTSLGRVGGARHTGTLDVLDDCRKAGLKDGRVWLANTDADSVVPPDWLLTQIQFAEAGFDAVIGTVTPLDLDPAAEVLWRQRHHLKEGHDHVHGANLGVRASAYVRAGGFAALAVAEDRDLVVRLQAITDRWVATHRNNVATSGRSNSRVDGGFATYIAKLGAGDASCV